MVSDVYRTTSDLLTSEIACDVGGKVSSSSWISPSPLFRFRRSMTDVAAFDKVSGRLFLHFTVLKARRELGAKPFRNRQSKRLRG